MENAFVYIQLWYVYLTGSVFYSPSWIVTVGIGIWRKAKWNLHSLGKQVEKKRDKLSISNNCASGRQHSGKVEDNESDQASRWSQKPWCVCVCVRARMLGGDKNKNQVTAALVGTHSPMNGKDTTPVLVKCQKRHWRNKVHLSMNYRLQRLRG